MDNTLTVHTVRSRNTWVYSTAKAKLRGLIRDKALKGLYENVRYFALLDA